MNHPAPAAVHPTPAAHDRSLLLQLVAVDLYNLVQSLIDRPELHPYGDTEGLPVLLSGAHQNISLCAKLASAFAERLELTLSSSSEFIQTLELRNQEIDDIRGLVDAFEKGFNSITRGFKGFPVVMAILESSNNLSDTNKADHEDLERLVADVQEDIARLKARLAELR